ncbi:MAG: hypothetical protein IPH23_02050 [Gammaproteobacteria bacterium]|nr:hypothetical protein [Gammaproteobacteria bacterium]
MAPICRNQHSAAAPGGPSVLQLARGRHDRRNHPRAGGRAGGGRKPPRWGGQTVLLPARNQKDAEEIPESARRQLDLHWIARVDEAEALALTPLANQAPETDVASDA